jgi:2-polyprenyl-6-methoxyphenol hydroxylase-like FAD-dependent oxidoreductase
MGRRVRVGVIGGGISGLSTAAAMAKKSDFQVSVFEAEPGLRMEGGALGIAPNGLHVLDELGLGAEIRQASHPIRNGIISDHELNRLTSFPPGAFGVGIPRSELLAILQRSAQGKATLSYGKRLSACEVGKDGVALTFADGTTHEADFLLGCDGIHSTVRAQVAPTTKVRFTGESYWAGISNHSVSTWDFCEAWGLGLRFGMVSLGGRTYWFAVHKSEQRQGKAAVDRAEVEALFLGFSPTVQAIIKATPPETMFLTDSLELDPADGAWSKGPICLVGDAAHATTPNLAQGANQALEDALTLACCLSKDPTARAFERFRSLRAEKVKMVVDESRRMGKVSVLAPPWAYLRNFVLRATPSSVMKSRFARMNDLGYLEQV